MKSRHFVRTAGILLATLCLGACGHRPDVTGDWRGQITLPGDGGIVPSTLTLRPNGTFHKQGGTQAEYTGTYSIQGDTLTETFTNYTVEGHTMSIPADTPNVETDRFTLSGDTLTLTPQAGGPPTVLQRQKG